MKSKFLCHRINCKDYQTDDSTFCPKHYAEHHSTSDPLDHLREHSIHNVDEENGPYEGDKFTIYNGKVYEIKAKDRTAWSLTRYDTRPVGQHYIVPLYSENVSVPNIIEVQRYLKEREEYMMGAQAYPGVEPIDIDSFDGQLQVILSELNDLLRKKNKDYGSSYDKTVEELGETVILVRIMDKFNRMKQLIKSGEGPEVEETIEETLSDLVGYGIIELVRRRRL